MVSPAAKLSCIIPFLAGRGAGGPLEALMTSSSQSSIATNEASNTYPNIGVIIIGNNIPFHHPICNGNNKRIPRDLHLLRPPMLDRSATPVLNPREPR